MKGWRASRTDKSRTASCALARVDDSAALRLCVNRSTPSPLHEESAMANEIIFHHYPTSPFSEKVRLAFGIKKLSWRSVEIPNMMPKPDLLPLTGGYRKTPVMQIGADIFCDTQIILRELERRFPEPSLFPHGKGLPYGLGFWSDRAFFMPTVGVVFGEIGHLTPEDFRKDRTA